MAINKPRGPQRYCIMGDDSGHEYFIKIEEIDKFGHWVAATENDEEIDCNFNDNRIDGHFTFTDPRCE